MSVHESDKAQRYIALLQAARLNAGWHDVPELARKVDKHAPHRKCLTVTATSEAHTAAAATAASAAPHGTPLDNAPRLVHQIDHEQTYVEDAFQATACLHEIYFLRADWSAVLAGLDHDVWQHVDRYSSARGDLSPNTRLALIKNRYLLGVAKEQTEGPEQAERVYRDALPAIDSAPDQLLAASEFRGWVERLLGRICTLHSRRGSTSSLHAANAALLSFRAWHRVWDRAPTKSSRPSYSLAPFDVSTRDVWGLYYRFLSSVLAADLVYTASPDAPLAFFSHDIASAELAKLRSRQRAELKQVESAYETLLLNETQFPQASQSNGEAERWAQQVVTNWTVLCGPRWREVDLGDGGKAAVGRGVLDILYRAATKTFHSTPILRHLFSVHASIAEFELAMKAFDAYAEIIGRAKSRAEKTGHHEVGLDTDDLVVLTAAQAISLLCRFGSQKEGEKAVDVAKRLSGWLQQQRPISSTTFAANESADQSGSASTDAVVSSESLAAAHRAIGESEANWARLTHDPAQRSEFREKAVKSLRLAAGLGSGDGPDTETALLLAVVLAESRELLPAIQVVKKALASSSQDQDQYSADVTGGAFARERQLIPLWHLMALLLTARGEYESAARICEAAFDQFRGPETLFGDLENTDSLAGTSGSVGLIHQMEDSEKEGLLQIRLTQLALTELLDNPETAVDATSELLALYNKLFDTPGAEDTHPPKDVAPVIPSAGPTLAPTLAPGIKHTGTLKSLSGSILGRTRTARSKTIEQPAAETTLGTPISIQVTNEDGLSPEKQHRHHHHHLPHHPLKHLAHHGHDAATQDQASTIPPRDADFNEKTLNDAARTTSPDQKLPPIPHNIDHAKQPPPLGHPNQPPSQDLRLPAPHPASRSSPPRPRFPSAQQKRHATSLIIDVWLYIAGQYTRAELFEDAEGAIDEAHKLTEGFQQALAREDSSAKAFDERGWGGGRSVNRLWADVWAERAALAATRLNSHDALSAYERALSHFPDHPAAITGISTILLDIYEQKISSEEPNIPLSTPNKTAAAAAAKVTASPSPAELTRLAARDRAYMLLNILTKQGAGWDDSEAWALLARAHEVSGQIERARECLWFLVELEDGRPIRPWDVVCSRI